MKIVIIHGQNHKGSTYRIANITAKKIGGEITEFFLPADFGEFCVGCTSCFSQSEEKCPHREKLQPILKAMDKAELIILASPVYVYHASGPMKAFLDHLGYRWIVHRPAEGMFSKQGLAISTAAGAGTKSTNKDMLDSLFFWGVAKRYSYGKNIAAVNWNGISQKKKDEIERETDRLAKKILRDSKNVKPGIKTKGFFHIMRMLQKKGWASEPDVKYWKEKGWSDSERPWK